MAGIGFVNRAMEVKASKVRDAVRGTAVFSGPPAGVLKARPDAGAAAYASLTSVTPIMASRPTTLAKRASDQPSVPAGRCGSTR